MRGSPVSMAAAKGFILAVEAALAAGHPPPGVTDGRRKGALAVATGNLDLPRGSAFSALANASRKFRAPDMALYVPRARTAPASANSADDLEAALRKAGDKGVPVDGIPDAIKAIQAKGVQISIGTDGNARIVRQSAPAHIEGSRLTLMSDKNNRFKIGAMGDQHVGSVHARYDVMNDLYRLCGEAGIKHVFNTGNWIEGESRFNRHELDAHSLDGQVRMLVERFPKVKGITTHAVWGDDHEGWYAQREGIDVGRYAQMRMREAGRTDWNDLGFMEAHVRLVNANTNKESIMAVVHPGGGSSYATSYAIQKIIESLDGGEKPAVGLYGHYHKLWCGNIRNVWCVQTGTACDQTTFMRKKKLEAHVGGVLIDLEQDPKTGAIIAMRPDLRRYFARGYYGDRWGYGNPVRHIDRGVPS